MNQKLPLHLFIFLVLLLPGQSSRALTFAAENSPPDSLRNKFFQRAVDYDDFDDQDDNDSDVKVIPWKKYDESTSGAMAVWICRESCSWLPLAHGLKTMGIPFFMTDDINKAMKQKVLMVYPQIAAQLVNTQQYFQLRDYVRNGGTLIGINVLGQGLQDVFGYDNTGYADNVNFVNFKKTDFKYDRLNFEYDKSIVVRNPKSDRATTGTLFYKNPTATVIANYDDGTAAILQNKFGNGTAIAFGVDIGAFTSLAYNGRQTDLARSYDNRYEPTLDILLRMIREFYRESGGITLGTCPFGKHLTVIFTHDIDYTASVRNSEPYAEFEKSVGISATYFMQTKYVKDWGDSAFFTPDNIEILARIRDMNMEIASHSVSHSKTYKFFETGDGEERYPTYHPFVENFNKTRNGSVYGEIRVSKQLLDSTLGVNVVSFRPGHLSVPPALAKCLSKTGYLYASSVTANDALGHYPFQLNADRMDVEEVPVFEFPVTIEDEEGILGDRINEGIELADQISKEDGICVILIHPNITGHKLKFEEEFYAHVKNFAWISNLKSFGAWWSSRNNVRVAFDGHTIQLDAPEPIQGLTLLLPNGKYYVVPELIGHLELAWPISDNGKDGMTGQLKK